MLHIILMVKEVFVVVGIIFVTYVPTGSYNVSVSRWADFHDK